jgi:hypothetical protein
MAAKKAAFLKETARAEQLLKARDFMKPYAAEVTAASVDQARSDFGGTLISNRHSCTFS